MKVSKRQNRRFLFITLLVLWNLALAACGTRSPQPNPAATTRPQRIVSLSPNVTEILYGVGAWPQVVAVSQYCTYPEDVKNKPRVDGWRDTNLEQVMALKPDLVIGIDTQAPFVQDKLNALGMHTLFVTSQNLADVFTSIKEIGTNSREWNWLSKRKVKLMRFAHALRTVAGRACSSSSIAFREHSAISTRRRAEVSSMIWSALPEANRLRHHRNAATARSLRRLCWPWTLR